MALEATATSSPTLGGFKTLQEEIAYYKTQYEHLEGELQEFQASSRELEAELEKDIEASEKRERGLKEKVEGLRFEVDEWKSKCKQAKAEANSAQNSLQKEITALRDGNRTLQLRLRDTEVANDDFERQARHTTSSLEDMESKFNVALERNVMMEEEIRAMEQERENLRIESQRLRDELADLRIEAEITQEKLRTAEVRRAGAGGYQRISQMSDGRSQGPQSPSSAKSTATMSTDSGFAAPKSEGSTVTSDAPTPPSPPLSESSPAMPVPVASGQAHDVGRTPSKLAAAGDDANATPRPTYYNNMTRSRHSRGPSSMMPQGPTATATPNFAKRLAAGRPSGVSQEPLPRSASLYQIRGLIGKMQKLEERVHSARSKLPAPVSTPPRSSPRGPSGMVPPSVTVRSSKKRSTGGATDTDGSTVVSHYSQAEGAERRQSHSRQQSRMSFGLSSHDSNASRPSSRLSNASNSEARFAPPNYLARPASRQQGTAAAEARGTRISLGGRATPSRGHRTSTGIPLPSSSRDEGEGHFATPAARRTTMDRSGIPGPTTTTQRLAARQGHQMGPPERRPATQDVGETF